MTDRIEAIRARHAAISASPAVADQQTADVAYLLDAYRHMVESWQTLEEMADEIGPLDHGAGCQSHFGKPCDCAWVEFRKVLTPVTTDSGPKCTSVWETCEVHGPGGATC